MLYQNARPTSWDEIIGNKRVVDSLRALCARPAAERPHAYLFAGPSGCGKTTLARILARNVGADEMDIVELNAANTRGIDTVRDVIEAASCGAMFGSSRVFVFDEAHQLAPAAQQALLKVLEDAPSGSYFILCSTDPHKIIETIRNRCATFNVQALREKEIESVIRDVIARANLIMGMDWAPKIAEVANGCPRSALMMLEQVYESTDEQDLAAMSQEVLTEASALDLCKALLSSRTDKWERSLAVLRSYTDDAESLRMAVLGFFRRSVLLEKDYAKAFRLVEILSCFEKDVRINGMAQLATQVHTACAF